MEGNRILNYDISKLRTPCFCIDKGLLKRNLEILAKVKCDTGCKILLALKGFAHGACSTL